MKKTTVLSLLILLSFGMKAQTPASQIQTERKHFRHPVLVKLIEGYGNVWRIGFMRSEDFYGDKDTVKRNDIHANFFKSVSLSESELKDKCFVYFPLSGDQGEMLIVSKSTITRLDIGYDKAIELIMVDNGN